MRGRKPIPSVLKIIRGNPGRRPLNADEPQPDLLAVACPEELLGDAVACAEWTRTVVPAIERGQVTAAERCAAIAHCLLWATWRSQLEAASHAAHVIAVGPNKYPAPNPARGMANKTFMLLLKVDAELGLTPSSRSRVHTTAPGRTKSRVEQYLAKKVQRA